MGEESGHKLTAANDPPILNKQILNREGAEEFFMALASILTHIGSPEILGNLGT